MSEEALYIPYGSVVVVVERILIVNLEVIGNIYENPELLKVVE